MLLMRSLNERLKHIKTIKAVTPSEPRVIFSEVPWMAADKVIFNFLYDNVHTKLYDVGDYVCTEGNLCEGVIIVVSGERSYNVGFLIMFPANLWSNN